MAYFSFQMYTKKSTLNESQFKELISDNFLLFVSLSSSPLTQRNGIDYILQGFLNTKEDLTFPLTERQFAQWVSSHLPNLYRVVESAIGLAFLNEDSDTIPSLSQEPASYILSVTLLPRSSSHFRNLKEVRLLCFGFSQVCI